MKVIVPGTIEPKIWTGKCNQCGAVIEAESKELHLQKGDRTTDYEPFAWADCMFCKRTSTVCFHPLDKKA